MVLWVRGLAALSALMVLGSAAGAGCGGLSSSEADLRCEQEQESISFCFNASVLAACEACYESCGDSCVRVASCPLSYECPGQTFGAGGGGASTGGASSQ